MTLKRLGERAPIGSLDPGDAAAAFQLQAKAISNCIESGWVD